ncbi:methionine--tRNA ligase, mitochondrial-like [Styela clava]
MRGNFLNWVTVFSRLNCKCRSNSHAFTTSLRGKSYYVTTPIFYVNSQPHLGHLYTATLADVAGRWQRLKNGKEVVFATGTDEHGQKIQEAAAEEEMEPKSFCDKVSGRYKDLYELCNIDYTDFIRTTDTRHKEAVHAFWKILEDKGYIYKGSYEGWYSTQDENFVTELQTKISAGHRISIESGHKVEWVKENNYVFRLSAVIDEVKTWARQNPSCVYPAKFHRVLLENLDAMTGDISISRESSRVSWGIETPSDSTQTVYVWLDALINYLTVAGFPDVNGERFQTTWPANCHIIGHDILKFHAIYWPAFLIAAGLDLPKQIVVHSHWLMNRRKMSKSLGNVINPFNVANSVSGERLKYFLIKQGVLEHDCDFTHHLLLQSVNGDLCNSLGNCLHRAVAPKLNPDQIYTNFYKDCYPKLISFSDKASGEKPSGLINLVQKLPDDVNKFCEDFHFYKAAEAIMECVRESNLLIHRNKTWRLDLHNARDKKLNDTALHCVYETLRVCGILLQPFVPCIANDMLDRLNVQHHERTFLHATKSFYGYGNSAEACPMTGRKLGKNRGVLIKKVSKIKF